MMIIGHCRYRREVRRRGGVEVAECGLLRQITGLSEAGACEVRDDACAACCASFPPSVDEINPVVASLLFGITDEVIARGGAPGLDLEEAVALQLRAERGL